MAQSYLETCIIEALRKAKGNQTKTRQLVASMAIEDDQLLLALARPHLNAIVAHAVNRIAIQQKGKTSKSKADDLPPIPKPSKEDAGFGIDLLKALGGQNVAKFGKEDEAPPIKKKAASAQHINALKLMAAKSKTKLK